MDITTNGLSYWQAESKRLGLVTINSMPQVVEVEYILSHYPKIADVQVLGVLNAFFGEELLAVVMPKTDMQITEQELRKYCAGQISRQNIPRYFQFVDACPLTMSDNVYKHILHGHTIIDSIYNK